MGSVVLDAVNTFFAPSHSQHHFPDAPSRARNDSTPPRRPRNPPPTDTLMSTTEQRAPSASAPHIASRENAPLRSTPHSQPQLADRSANPLNTSSYGNAQDTAAGPDASSSAARPPRRKIKVRDLEHIQSFATENMGAFSEIRNRSRSRTQETAADDSPQFEISEMKVEHIIEMVAGLLTKITTTNDQQHEHLHRQSHLENTSHMTQTTSSVLAFHGKNVPSITILSYLSRINKYCPTSYEVFLSLLVYFDRMTERVNAGPMQSLRQANQHAAEYERGGSPSDSSDSDKMEGVTATTPQGTQTATPPSSGGLERIDRHEIPGTPHSRPQADSPSIPPEPSLDAYDLSHFFVVDSFNIHRLVIAGVTCASKFFSDIFYTNSRYAKVGGLPLQELNHLELQFLLLNDFRLSVPVEEIEAYGTMLVEFYAREVVAQQRAAQAEAMSARSLSESSTESTATVRAAT